MYRLCHEAIRPQSPVVTGRQWPQRLSGRRDGLGKILVRVGQGDEVCFELGRRQVDAVFQHGVEVDLKASLSQAQTSS